jgi:hypothetical protein
MVGREIVDTRRVRALVMNGTALIGVVLGRSEMAFPASRTPTILISSTGSSRDPSVILADDSIEVRGYGFLPGTNANDVDIVLDDENVVEGIAARSDGTFSAKVPVVRGPGPVAVRATQRDGNRTTTTRGSPLGNTRRTHSCNRVERMVSRTKERENAFQHRSAVVIQAAAPDGGDVRVAPPHVPGHYDDRDEMAC